MSDKPILSWTDQVALPGPGMVRSFLADLDDEYSFNLRAKALLDMGVPVNELLPTLERELREASNAAQGIETVATIPVPGAGSRVHIVIEKLYGDYLIAWHDAAEQRLGAVVLPLSVISDVVSAISDNLVMEKSSDV